MKTRMCEGVSEAGLKVMTERPLARTRRNKKDMLIVTCPVCGNKDNIDNFDCLGADVDCVFCNSCQTELAL